MKKNISIYLMLIIFSLYAVKCSRFRIKELKKTLLYSLDILRSDEENPNMYIQVIKNKRERSIRNLPIRPEVTQTKIYIADVSRQFISIFRKGQKQAELIIGTKRPESIDKKIKFHQINIQTPGWIASNEDRDRFYVQSFFDVKKWDEEKKLIALEKRRPFTHSRLIQSPSIILVFHKEEGRLLSKIGKGGPNGEPFDLIVRMQLDKDGKLYVLHKSKKDSMLELFVFRNTVLLQHFRMPVIDPIMGNTNFKNSTTNFFFLEHIQPVAGKNFVIGLLSIRNKNNFEIVERIIYRQDKPNARPHILLRNQSLTGSLVWASPEGGFSLLQIGDYDEKLLFKIYNSKGEYRKNKSIYFTKPRSSWRDIFLNIEGDIFTSRIYRGKYMVYEWE